ncbi:MAG: ATP-binding protein [Bacteroidales bacterium]|nr:ATP-binding protein [Bacteroidales bacterium]
MVNRKIYSYLKDFFLNDKKSLLVTGARQVGKTYAIRKVGEETFKHFVEFNFIRNPKLKSIFANPIDTNDILLRISAMTDTKLEQGKTLIFFDEVQECPEIVTAIKFLVDEGSYRYVMSGSLLGVELKDLRSVPVGYMAEKEMYPLDFDEFAQALGMSDDVMAHLHECFEKRIPVDPVVHEKMMELLRLYLVIGGMPAVVSKYLETNNMQDVRHEQENIIKLYKKDISKYISDNKLFIKEIFDRIPSELNAQNKRFILKSLNDRAKFEKYENSFLWLTDAGVGIPTYNVDKPCVPLKLNEQRNLFKLFLNDVGLLSCMYSSGFQLNIMIGEINTNFGAVFENFAAQELHSHGYDLYYFNSKKQGELDFVIEHDGQVLPIEIKSGKDYKRHNALCNVMKNEEYAIKEAFVFTTKNIEILDRNIYLPVYMLMYLRERELPNKKIVFRPM